MIQYLIFEKKSDKILAELKSEIPININEKLYLTGIKNENYKVIEIQHQCMTTKDEFKISECQTTIEKIIIVVKCKSIHI